MKTNTLIILALLLLCGVVFAWAQNATDAVDAEDETASFQSAATGIQQRLERSIKELNELRERMAEEKIPLTRRLSRLEGELVQVRLEYQQTSRKLDSRTLDLSNLKSEIKSRQDEATYLSNLLGEFIRNFETRLHIAEIQRYREPLEVARLAPENNNLTKQQVYDAQTGLVSRSVERLLDSLGGARFNGSAVDAGGLVKQGSFALVGPAALFQSEDGKHIGTAEQRLGSLEPTLIEFANPANATAAAEIFSNGSGAFPLDPSLGNAHKIEATEETFLEHVKKGGPVMYPIFILAGLALLVALWKWLNFLVLPIPSSRRVNALMTAVAQHDDAAVQQASKKLNGPVGEVLRTGSEHLGEPRDLIEEVMYERILSRRLKLQRLLPFIAISAAAAPLLGLLGTVTGIINTFKLIELFGAGDVKSLSGGISEALITTKFGLIVAIPALLLHAFLYRKSRGIINQMEKAAVSFVNQVSRSPYNKIDKAA